MKLNRRKLRKMILNEIRAINNRMEPYSRQQDTDFSVPMRGTLSYGRGGQYIILSASVEMQGKPFQFQGGVDGKNGLDLEQVMQNPSVYVDEIARQTYPSFSSAIGEYAGLGYESTLSYDLFKGQLEKGLEAGTIRFR